uniref:Uncharacterized protein n=1 Tax=Aegilops tauschii subsp. strangulata TaxID=200361 RepID=A0A453MBG1_AEGTS
FVGRSRQGVKRLAFVSTHLCPHPFSHPPRVGRRRRRSCRLPSTTAHAGRLRNNSCRPPSTPLSSVAAPLSVATMTSPSSWIRSLEAEIRFRGVGSKEPCACRLQELDGNSSERRRRRASRVGLRCSPAETCVALGLHPRSTQHQLSRARDVTAVATTTADGY